MSSNGVVNSLTFMGSATGQATLQAQSVGGEYILLLPNQVPSVSQVLGVQGVNGSLATLAWISPASSSASGTVTSVAMTVPSFLSVSGSPVTSSGTFAVTLANQNANLVFAGPASGAANTPGFRALVAADIPTLNQNTTGTAGGLSGSPVVAVTGLTATGFVNSYANITAGLNSYTFGLSSSPSLIWGGSYQTSSAPAYAEDTWTVYNLIGSGVNGTSTLIFSHSGTSGAAVVSIPNLTVTTFSGTPAFSSVPTFPSQTQNTFFAAPNGSSGSPVFRAIVAADIPTLNQNTTGTAANLTASAALPSGTTITGAALVAGTGISLTGTWPNQTVSVATNSNLHFSDEEIPSGLINSTNVTYTLANTPNPAASVLLFLNGLLQQQGTGKNYTLSGTTITMTTAPTTGASLLAWYRY